MGFSLYDAVIPPFGQILGAVAELIVKAEAHCAEGSIPCDDLVQARLAPDMLPLAYQIKSTASHSIGAIEGVRKGVFSPDMTPPPKTFADLAQVVADARAALAAVTREELDALIGRDMRFQMGERRIDFTAENFLLSFSTPNFYFHATTAYDILRANGLPIGKRDFLGAPATKQG